MPLGHTAKVRSGEITDLRDYALLSLRAWRSAEGAVEIDYDVVGAEERPNPYYARKLEEAQSRLASLKAMKAEEAALHARETHTRAHGAWSEWTREKKVRRKRTEDMTASAGYFPIAVSSESMARGADPCRSATGPFLTAKSTAAKGGLSCPGDGPGCSLVTVGRAGLAV